MKVVQLVLKPGDVRAAVSRGGAAMSEQTITVADVRRLKLSPGDTLLVTLPPDTGIENVNHAIKGFSLIAEEAGCRVVVIADGTRVEVLSPEAARSSVAEACPAHGSGSVIDIERTEGEPVRFECHWCGWWALNEQGEAVRP